MKKTILSLTLVSVLFCSCNDTNSKETNTSVETNKEKIETIEKNALDRIYSESNFLTVDMADFEKENLLNDTTGYILMRVAGNNGMKTDAAYKGKTYREIIDSIYKADKSSIIEELDLLKNMDVDNLK